MKTKTAIPIVLMIFSACATLLIPTPAPAHCDTMAGPVVAAARSALDKGDVTPVLKWVRKEDEDEIREQFKRTLVARKQGKEAKELADRYFFETLVRIHRAGEGAPYTGLKSEPAEPVIQAADKALETGSADNLVKHVTEAAAAGIRERFAYVKEKKKHADESIEAGREFVAAYVEFTHFVERLHATAASPCGCGHHEAHHGEMKHQEMEGHHGH